MAQVGTREYGEVPGAGRSGCKYRLAQILIMRLGRAQMRWPKLQGLVVNLFFQ